MSLRRTTGIILRVSSYGESDKIVTLYCPREGRLDLIAKGACRSKKRFVNKLELFSHLDIIYNDRYALALLEQAELLESFLTLRRDFKRYAAAILLLEHMLHWSSENDGDPQLYAILLSSLRALNEGGKIRKNALLFLIQLYSRLGYEPALSACGQCGLLSADSAPFQFIKSQGTIICRRCAPQQRADGLLNINTIKLIEQAQRLPFTKTRRLQFPAKAEEQALKLFRSYGNYLLDRHLNGWDFL